MWCIEIFHTYGTFGHDLVNQVSEQVIQICPWKTKNETIATRQCFCPWDPWDYCIYLYYIHEWLISMRQLVYLPVYMVDVYGFHVP